jgi:hypothetical protein
MYIGLHLEYRLFFWDCNETWISQPIFKIFLNIKFHENLSSGSQVILYRQLDGETYKTEVGHFLQFSKHT